MRPSALLLSFLVACSGSDSKDRPNDKDGPPTDGTTEETGHTGVTTDTETEPPPEPVSLVVNEIMPGNQSALNGPDGASMPDWIELVNTGDQPFAFERLQIRSDSGGFWEGAARDGELAPGERTLIWFGADAGGGGLWTGFALDRENDELILVTDAQTVIAEIPIADVPNDVAMMRIPDLTGDFALTVLGTPGEVNADAPTATLNAADETVFRSDVVHRIDFLMTQDDYRRLSNYDRPEIHSEMTIDGVYYADVGLKLKGSASYSDMSGKPAFIVDMNEWVPGTRYRGLRAFRLHNGNVLDPTRCRDWLTYKLAREAGLMAPRVGWAEVYVGPLYYGIYMIIERHDASFIEYHHPTQVETGVVMEPNESQGGGWGGGDFGGGTVNNWNFEEGPVPPDPLAVEALTTVDQIAALPGTEERATEMWNHLDRELFLTYLAWENVVMHTDGYMAPNNWRVYIDGDTHRVSLLPSGAEWTWDAPAPGLGSPFGWYGGRLGNWCGEIPSCRHDYAAKLVEVADLADSLNLDDEFISLSTWLDPYIDADPRYSSWATADDTRPTTLNYLRTNPTTARDWATSTYPDLLP